MKIKCKWRSQDRHARGQQCHNHEVSIARCAEGNLTDLMGKKKGTEIKQESAGQKDKESRPNGLLFMSITVIIKIADADRPVYPQRK